MITIKRIAYSVFATLFVSALISAQSPSMAAGDDIAASAAETHPVGTGEMAPRFTVRTVDDEPFDFDPTKLDRPVVLVTFRGGWCPYCNMHLSELRHVVPALADKGIDVLFLSGDRPDQLYVSLKQETREDIEGLGYRIYSDADIDAARALGIAFYADPDYIAARESKGDIAGSSMKDHGVLPVPAVYVIDTDGRITFSFVEPDYKIRLPADKLLEAANEVLESNP